MNGPPMSDQLTNCRINRSTDQRALADFAHAPGGLRSRLVALRTIAKAGYARYRTEKRRLARAAVRVARGLL